MSDTRHNLIVGLFMTVLGFILAFALQVDMKSNAGRILSFITLLAGWAAVGISIALNFATWQEAQPAFWVCFGAVAYFGIRTARGK